MITSRQLDEMRQTLRQTMNLSANKLVKSNVSDGRGGMTVTWVTDGNFPCHLATQPLSYTAQIGASAISPQPQYRMTYPHDQVLDSANRVRIDGREYEILHVYDNASHCTHGRASLKVVD